MSTHSRIVGRVKSGLFLVAALAGVLALQGCPDPEGEYNSFNERTKDDRDVKIAEVGGGTLVDVTGTFLLGLSPVIAPAQILMFTTESVYTPNDDPTTGGTLEFKLQPRANSPNNKSLEPVGAVIEGSAPVDADGNFTMDLGEQDVLGDANPISGSDIKATLKLIGTIRSADLMCGSVEGAVTTPIQAPLDGSSFGMVRIESADATLPTPTVACPATGPDEDAGPTDDADAGTVDAGPTEDTVPGDTDAGPVEPTCPTIDHSGIYTLQFITDTQKGQGADPSTLGLELVKSDDDAICYTGALLSLVNPGEELAHIDDLKLVGTEIQFTAKDFEIPPGANPLLPNGGKANVTFTGTTATDNRMCGTIVFSLFEPFALDSNGTFAAAKDDSGWTVEEPECTGLVPPAGGCELAPYAGTYELLFITDTQKGQGADPTSLELQLDVAADETVCLTGGLMSKQNPGEQLAAITSVTVAGDGFTFTAEDFEIPPGANPLLPNGGKANIAFTAGAEKKTGDTFCGTIVFSLYEPFALDSNGTFAAARKDVAPVPTAPECDGL